MAKERYMTIRDWIYVGLLCIACVMVGYGIKQEQGAVTPDTPVQHYLVCFDYSKNVKLQLVEYNIRFEGGVIRFSNGTGEYAIYPLQGWMCSNVVKP